MVVTAMSALAGLAELSALTALTMGHELLRRGRKKGLKRRMETKQEQSR